MSDRTTVRDFPEVGMVFVYKVRGTHDYLIKITSVTRDHITYKYFYPVSSVNRSLEEMLKEAEVIGWNTPEVRKFADDWHRIFSETSGRIRVTILDSGQPKEPKWSI